MALHRVRGRASGLGATAELVVAQVWNPSTTRRIYVLEFAGLAASSPSNVAGGHLRRSTARGSGPTSTQTPTADHADERDAAPDSGWVLDLGNFTTQPTLVALPSHFGWLIRETAASGFAYRMSEFGICVPPGTGLCLCQNQAEQWDEPEISVVVDD